MNRLMRWLRRYRKWLLGLGAGYVVLELLAALAVALGLLAMKG